jgi:uncharacterized membrane protein YGL010W
MPNFAQYMAQYDHEHTNAWNKLLHGIGIPIILALFGASSRPSAGNP